MNLANKKFRNNLTGDVVSVLDSFENIAILNDEKKTRMDAKHLTNAILYTEISAINESYNTNYNNVDEVLPESFFSNQGAYNVLADKIKNIPESMIKDDPTAGQVSVKSEGTNGDINFVREQANTEESAVIMVSEEDERAELARKYGVTDTSALDKQNEAFSRLLNDDVVEEEVQRINVDEIVNVEPQEPIQRTIPTIIVETPPVEDPILKMFKGVKRNTEFNITIDINNKIPRVDFIEMMEDSYETSIIDFLADEFTKNILNDPSFIKEMIKDKIKEVVYGVDEIQVKTPIETPPVEVKTSEAKAPVKRRSTRKEIKEKI